MSQPALRMSSCKYFKCSVQMYKTVDTREYSPTNQSDAAVEQLVLLKLHKSYSVLAVNRPGLHYHDRGTCEGTQTSEAAII